MAARPCLDCGKPTNRRPARCDGCNSAWNRERNSSRTWYGGDWQAKSRAVRSAWVAEHGLVCPGYDCSTHAVDAVTDLTVDHVEGRSEEAGLTVLCRACNGRKGGSHERGAHPHPPTQGTRHEACEAYQDDEDVDQPASYGA